MTELRGILEKHFDTGPLRGAVALVARGDRAEEETVGSADIKSASPMTRDSIFRIASLTKPIVAAAVMMLIEEGRIALDDPVREWLPEIASPSVVRTPASPVDDVVPAERPVTVADLLTFRAGWGFPSDFSLPAVAPLFSELKQGLEQQAVPPPDAWMETLGRIPMLHQPGDGWLYNTCSDIQGVLIARVSGCGLPDFLAERIFEPLGMADTGFTVPDGKLGRFTDFYRAGDDGDAVLLDAADGQWRSVPPFPAGGGGLVSTLDDWLAFARMLLAGGEAAGGRRLLSQGSVGQMTTDHLTRTQRKESELFLEGQGWGYGGSVDVETREPWNVPGRYGWVGGTGTAAHLVPSTGAITILLTQLSMTGPMPTDLMRDFWRYAAAA